jgi:alpha-amylase
VTDPSFEANRWFTPLKGEADHLPSFQDYGRLVAYASVMYSDASLTAATVTVHATHKDPSVTFTCSFGGTTLVQNATADKSSCEARFSKEQTGPLAVAVKASDGSEIQLEEVDFHWNTPAVKEREGDYRGGQKGAVVEMFGWPHADIEQECKALATMGYLGVKVFPIHEQVMSSEPFQNMMNPWYFMYQPVSYQMQGRMGTRDELRKMIATCRSYGVRVYADAVVNHMSGGGNDANTYHRNPQAGCSKWGNKTSSRPGGHSPFYTQDYTYTIGEHTGKQPLQEFPAVPYGPLDFHCERPLNSWTDPLDLNAGWLTGLTDLNTERDNVQERIAAYLTDMIGIGFSGFRIDAAKHIQPDDLVGILSKFKRNVGGALPSDFFTWLEILLGGEADLLMCNAQSGYNFGSYFTSKLSKAGFTEAEIQKIKTWNSGYPKEPEKGVDDCDIGKSGLQRQVIQNDDHDQQNPGSSSRDMGNSGCVLIKGCAESEHRNFEVQLFTAPPGSRDNKNDYPIRNVLSSFYWGEGDVQGMPDGKSDCSLCTINCDSCKTMTYEKAFDATSKGYDSGKGKYTRVHRDQAIVNAMRSWMGLQDLRVDDSEPDQHRTQQIVV